MIALTLWMATTLLSAAPEIPAAAAAEGLSSADWRSLEEGDSVLKQQSVSGSHAREREAVGWVIVRAPWEPIFDLLTDHAEWIALSGCLEAVDVVRKVSGPGHELIKVRETHTAFFKRFRYTVDYFHDRSKREVRWRLDPTEPHDIGSLKGAWRLVPLDENRTLVAYALAGSSGGTLSKALEEMGARMRIPQFLERLRDRVERRSAS
jgi:hypothetical protein